MNDTKQKVKITHMIHGANPKDNSMVIVKEGIYNIIKEDQSEGAHKINIEAEGYENGVIITKGHPGYIEFI